MRLASLLLVVSLLAPGLWAADKPVVGIAPRSAITVKEGQAISIYYYNSLLGEGWDWSKIDKMVTIRVKLSGTVSNADVGGRFRNLTSLVTVAGRWFASVPTVKDGMREGAETLTLEILPDPRYTIDPARAKVTFTVVD